MSHLKKADEYRARLHNYAMACGITVEYHEKAEDEGSWIPTRRKVVIDYDLETAEEIATLLHELGHMMDDFLLKKFTEKRLSTAYKALYSCKPTRKQKALVVECEERAWDYGKAIAKKLKIPLGRWYEREREEALKSYRDCVTQNR